MNAQQEDWFALFSVFGIVALFVWFLVVVIL